ncbi:hypothetical protein [Oricola indica]|uniref:hypothetical protein n=1 Tax=Oricola indica TaxID=2872591 RepID=UPI003CCBC60E
MNWLDYFVILAGLGAAIWLAIKLRRKYRMARNVRRPGDKTHDYPVRQDWSKSSAKVNYSSFVFYDVDRDGRYGLADRPITGIHVRLYNDETHLRRSVSNINGFANFLSSTTLRRAPIRKPGAYRFEVSVPPGWRVTSRNDIQTAQFSAMPGSPAGIGAEAMLRPVGLAPLRWIGGMVNKDGISIEALANGEVLASQTPASGSRFRFELPEETDCVRLFREGASVTFAPGACPVELGTIAPEQSVLSDTSDLRTIGFDDLTASGLKKVPNGYAGLDWFNLNAMSREFTSNSFGYSNGTTSGDYAVYTSSGHPAEISRDEPFSLFSMMLTAAWAQSEGETALVECWNGETLLRSDEVAVSSLTPVRHMPMLPAVTRIRVSTRHYWQLVIDDIVIA